MMGTYLVRDGSMLALLKLKSAVLPVSWAYSIGHA